MNESGSTAKTLHRGEPNRMLLVPLNSMHQIWHTSQSLITIHVLRARSHCKGP